VDEAASDEPKEEPAPWLRTGAALELLAGAGVAAIFTAMRPWPSCDSGGDCPSPQPWALSDQAGFLGLLLWMGVAVLLVPLLVGDRVRRHRWVAVCAVAAAASAPVGAGAGVLFAKWLSPVAYSDSWVDKSVEFWVGGAVVSGIVGFVFLAAPAALFALLGTALGRSRSPAPPLPAEHASPRQD
jgi:hypothetical protein